MRKTTVADVMTRNPIAVTASTPFKELVQLLDRAQISAVPVVDQQNRVIGVVSEADLLRKHECADLELVGLRRPPDIESRAAARTAGELMTAPAMTVGPDAFLPSATRLLTEAGVRRLYVVDGAGRLIGVTSRRDLLSSFLRQDRDIRDEVRIDVLRRLHIAAPDLRFEVANGVVTLAGRLPGEVDRRAFTDRIAQVPGVIGINDRLTR